MKQKSNFQTHTQTHQEHTDTSENRSRGQVTLGLFWKFPAGAFHAVKLPWNNPDTSGRKASCFPRSARDLLLRSFACSLKIILFLRRQLSLPSLPPRKSPVCDPRIPMGGSYTLPAPASACTRLCFISPRALLQRRTKSEWETVTRWEERYFALSCCSWPYNHALSVWYQPQEKLCLGQPNLNQAFVGNSRAPPGGGTGLPSPPLLHVVLQKPQITPSHSCQLPWPSDAQIHVLFLHPPPSCPPRMQPWTAKKSLRYNVINLLSGN